MRRRKRANNEYEHGRHFGCRLAWAGKRNDLSGAVFLHRFMPNGAQGSSRRRRSHPGEHSSRLSSNNKRGVSISVWRHPIAHPRSGHFLRIGRCGAGHGGNGLRGGNVIRRSWIGATPTLRRDFDPHSQRRELNGFFAICFPQIVRKSQLAILNRAISLMEKRHGVRYAQSWYGISGRFESWRSGAV